MVTLEDLKILQKAEAIADNLWKEIHGWKAFPRDIVGKQLARSADSIGANMAESFGRFHYGEKIQFLYFARGSLFETKYWINRALKRQLINAETAQTLSSQLSELAHHLNAWVKTTRNWKREAKNIKEEMTDYMTQSTPLETIFDSSDIRFLESLPEP